jgi:hypothetical protein
MTVEDEVGAGHSGSCNDVVVGGCSSTEARVK